MTLPDYLARVDERPNPGGCGCGGLVVLAALGYLLALLSAYL